MATRGHEQQDVTFESPWRECAYDTYVALANILHGLVVLRGKMRRDVSVAAEALQQLAQGVIGHCRQRLSFAFLVAAIDQARPFQWVTVEKGEQRDLFVHG